MSLFPGDLGWVYTAPYVSVPTLEGAVQPPGDPQGPFVAVGGSEGGAMRTFWPAPPSTPGVVPEVNQHFEGGLSVTGTGTVSLPLTTGAGPAQPYLPGNAPTNHYGFPQVSNTEAMPAPPDLGIPSRVPQAATFDSFSGYPVNGAAYTTSNAGFQPQTTTYNASGPVAGPSVQTNTTWQVPAPYQSMGMAPNMGQQTLRGPPPAPHATSVANCAVHPPVNQDNILVTLDQETVQRIIARREADRRRREQFRTLGPQ